MKNIRKSFSSHKEPHISSPLPPLSKPTLTAIQPPVKVIRAIQSHRSNSPHQLSFEKGDFFHVLNDPKDGQWYEAHNPSTGARGLVRVDMFEEFAKGSATPRTPVSMSMSAKRPETPSTPKTQTFYAVVLHDFTAERADELDAKAGDAITVVAQSNREWLVAKPIGKLGRPGLIPVAFVELRDPATGQSVEDVARLIDGGALPPVEEWKRQVMSYKANSISLGVLDESVVPQVASSSSLRSSAASPAVKLDAPSPHPYNQQQPIDEPPLHNILPAGILISADVKSFHFEMDEYWFRVHAIYQPYGTGALPPAKELVLFRSYNDFYDFQVALLDTFPREAGRQSTGRILPYMPGPVPHVDSAITLTRRQELDDYLHELCGLSAQGARSVIESEIVREFLATKPGDAAADIEPQVQALEAISYDGNSAVTPDVEYSLNQRISNMRLSAGPDSGYEESDHFGKGRSSDTYGYDPVDRHHRAESTASMYKTGTSHPHMAHSRSSSRTNSAMDRVDSYGHMRNSPSLEIDTYQANGYPRSSMASSNDLSPARSSHAPSVSTSVSSQRRTPSSATPPISSSIPQTAFIKIKIFDKSSDDLVAIRVHPRVTHEQLMDKVQARLGESVTTLRYRDSVNNALVNLLDDEDLRLWLDNTDRLVLYAASE